MKMTTRRNLLAMGAGLISAGLAGCSRQLRSVAEREQNTPQYDPLGPIPPLRERERWAKEEQQQAVPKPSHMFPHGVPNDQGEIAVELQFDRRHPDGKEFDQTDHLELYNSSADKVKYELYVYETYPVGNEIELTKIGETTSRIGVWYEKRWDEEDEYKHGSQYNRPRDMPLITADFDKVPKDKPIRFRVRGTNQRTGESKFVWDERNVSYKEWEGDLFCSQNRGLYPIGDTSISTEHIFDGVIESSGNYKWYFNGRTEIDPSSLINSIPYSAESYSKNRESKEPDPINTFSTKTIEVSQEEIKMVEWIEDEIGIYNSRDDLTFHTESIPQKFDVNVNSYSTLDNPLLTSIADAIKEGQEGYGWSSHFAQIDKARRMVQVQQYDPILNSFEKTREQQGLAIATPERYWMEEPAENCVGHTFNLCWLLYHLGYTCGAAYIDVPDSETDHEGVAIPVPKDVQREDFPDGYPEVLEESRPHGDYVETTNNDLVYSNPPESLGDHPWMYIEPTGVYAVGLIPWDADPEVMFAIEPEDNEFGTDILAD